MQKLRKQFVALVAVGVVLSAMSWTAAAQQLYQWSGWFGTNAANIEYRYEITGQYLVMVQFRNDSNNAVTIGYSIWAPGQNQAQTGTTYANAGATSGAVNVNTTNGQPPSRVDVQLK